jgi:hypothetical protein
MPQMSQRLIDGLSRQRKYQLRHKRVGLCCDCSRPVASGTLFCELHRRKRNVENREWQRKRFKRKIRYRNAESYRFTGGATLAALKTRLVKNLATSQLEALLTHDAPKTR